MMSSKEQPLYSENRLVLHEALPMPHPKAIFLEPTTYCNFKCKYCVHSVGKEKFEKNVRPYQYMTDEMMARIVEQISLLEQPLNLVEISGVGEPLLHPKTPEFIKKIKDTNKVAHVRMITNASLLTKDLTHKIVDAGLDTVRVSLQGIKDETYKAMCGTSIAFERIVENLMYFNENKKNTQLNVKNINIALDDDEKEEFIRIFEKNCDRLFIEEVFPFFTQVDYNFLEKTDTNRYHQKKLHLDVCPTAFPSLIVNVEGFISVCGKEVGPCYLGNIKDISFMDAWMGETRTKFLIQQLEKRRYENKICENCSYPSDSLSSEKDILDPYADEVVKKYYAMLAET